MVLELYKGDKLLLSSDSEQVIVAWRNLLKRGVNAVAFDSEGNKYYSPEELYAEDIETDRDDVLYTTED